MADKKISELTALTGALNVADALAIADDSASQTKKISPKDLIQAGITLIDAGSIPADKVTGLALPDGSVTTAKLADGAVTAIKLADNSSGVVTAGVLSAGARVGQVGLSTTDNKLYVWDGSAWRGIAAPESVNGISVTNGLIEIAVTDNGDGTVTLAPTHRDTTGARQFLAGPTASAGAVSQRQIVGADLPVATPTSNGAITVNGGGLTVDGTGLISIDNAVAAQTSRSLVTYDANGLVQSGSPIVPTDLPIATTTTVGVVRPGDLMTVDGVGDITIDNVVSPGTYPKVSINGKGLVTSGANLEPSDIPDIPADKIDSGELSPAVIGDRSIQEIKLADYSTCLVQEGQPSSDYKLGQFWFTPSTNQLRVYTRGSAGDRWESIGFGALQQSNLRWGGTCDASTSQITTLTAIGVSEGLEAGDPLPNPTDELSGLYFVVQVGGNAITIPNVNGENCTEGDWILYVDQAQGALHLDVSAGGGGGGGGASKLNDLTDVDLNTVEDDQLLQYDSITGMWKNVSLISGGTF